MTSIQFIEMAFIIFLARSFSRGWSFVVSLILLLALMGAYK